MMVQSEVGGGARERQCNQLQETLSYLLYDALFVQVDRHSLATCAEEEEEETVNSRHL